jgi:beta-lactam-binding protein with PASTA domain
MKRLVCCFAVLLSTSSCTPSAGSARVTETPSRSTSTGVTVPDLVGLDVIDAERVLDEAGLTMGFLSALPGPYDRRVGAVVVDQSPGPGSSVPPDAPIAIVFGPKRDLPPEG